jgi:(3S)-malyl-CoA thioesterase
VTPHCARNNILLQRGKSELDFAEATWFHPSNQFRSTEVYMDHRARPYRSVLYIPGSKPRALEKAKSLPVDAIIFDLEDAVSAEEKPAARKLLAETLAEGGYGPRAQIVRINGFETEWSADDFDTIAAIGPQAILLPKVNGPTDVEALADMLDARPETADTTIWAMMETSRGILNANAIAGAPRMAGLVLGTNDLGKELNSRTRSAMTTSLQWCLLAARAHGLVCVDGVYNAFKDEEGLRAECAEGRDFGFDGKTLIHPAQVAIANEAFAPSPEEVDLARRQIDAYEAAVREGQGVAVVDGRIVENLHVDTARATLARAEAIAAVEAA